MTGEEILMLDSIACAMPRCPYPAAQGQAWCRDHHPRRCTGIKVDGTRCREIVPPTWDGDKCSHHRRKP